MSAVLSVALVAVASAFTPPSLEEGIASYWSGDYRGTIETLSSVCDTGLRRDETAECLKYLAFSFIAVGDGERAQQAFRGLLATDRGYALEPSLVSPKIMSQFALAQQAVAAELFVSGKSSYFDGAFDEARTAFEAVQKLDEGHALANEYLQLLAEREELARTEQELASQQIAPAAAAMKPAPETQPDDVVYHVTSDIVPPELIERVDPVYPIAARRAGREGTVVITTIVDADGSVREARIIRGASAELDRAAVEAVKQWTYRPAIKNGSPVPVYSVVQLAFSLRR